ncbi:hypothetical protein COV53_03220 [Candidatus Gottesmanbacteria bacterium CG11_big_fil_rev_8_21_14_0_20_37_11]|uniref:Small-conductance mechanosensitive ion channel n=3 Tax=Candidatus Gottesmaniibacteriota TaxID=1752720 RepID=A0A2M7RQE7_9BACT|nr:MAG: hypothetical protein AUJ73_04885 [Candidatus Gottesmanbacteria bacterium CG1_02_37_22]PIP33059.1 MAG: hypothetical protein COX23_01425 [Candidatus Gottesmanbacteria bacterium CG23_combo_of_CG06-09_8_20_14_all_37_19]PIR08407.1 MAG: hypothetical protein COV53_03220 [Candidatus Gottesmanbacteria bacterium CG11_big_fil_rev_8_21_14_0_20_37_11]PIZ02259.1 MAG: hypothetical protein COY59_05775 [Candidatus Gottesmanbacteria bacterium CG_4_10_14_0_8_um_filter_37_24]
MNVFIESLSGVLNSVFFIISAFIPKLIAGSLIIFIGLILASLIKDFIIILFKYFRIEKWLQSAGLVQKDEVVVWPNLIFEVIRWIIIFIFLMSAIDVWGIPKVADLLNQLLLFLPNVFVAVVIGWIGLISARFVFDIVRHSLSGVGRREALVLGNIAKYSILFFTALIVLTQLGVASELVKILFTGIVSMVAIAFGLSFGLGGKDEAKRILESLREQINKAEGKKVNKK